MFTDTQAGTILEMIDNLVNKGYTVQICQYGEFWYKVNVLGGKKQIAEGYSRCLADAVYDAYQMVSEIGE